MGNSLRCCLACVLPFGALDLIRIVHLNGNVEEYTRPITAGEILEANPNHVLSKPCSQGVVRRIMILSPESELKRGSIYFLIPSSSLPEKKKKLPKSSSNGDNKIKSTTKKIVTDHNDDKHRPRVAKSDVATEKKPSHRDRRHHRNGVWRVSLESITEEY
ncbi:hypothetical protein ACFE04_013314 [Oxalis oulophora]